MSSTFERTFSVSVPVERAWRAFTDPEELEVWFASRFDADAETQTATAASPGGPVGFAVTEFDEGKRLAYRQWAADPESGIDVTVTFEAIAGGTRITMTQAGFGKPSFLTSEQVQNGVNETLADLVLYLEHGVRFARHRDLQGTCWIGADMRRVPGAVQVTTVDDQSFASDVGLECGDLLLQLGRAPVFEISDVVCIVRGHDVGDELLAVWGRGGEVLQGRARLTARDTQVFAHRV